MPRFIDLTGKKYFRLTVMGQHKKRDRTNKILWDCICECGTESVVLGLNLAGGRVKSCGCYGNECRANKKVDLCGKKFGRLSVLSEDGRNKDGNVMWLCKCDCGNEIITSVRNLVRGDTHSCGCYRDEYYSSARKHGHTFNGHKTSEYRSWSAMKARCLNAKNKYYYNYGGRGIKICKRWINGFENFIQDMGPKPSSKHSLERINNNRGYTPKNCKWATRYE